MARRDAIAKGWVTAVEGHGYTDEELNETIHIPAPTLERRRWVRGVKNQRALPAKSSECKKYNSYIREIGKPLPDSPNDYRWMCMDIATDADGALMTIHYTYEFSPVGIDVINPGQVDPP